jgi:WD40 repeat protein/energy-coupling factor transporter ATP-binding protein EcfA2
MASLFVSHSSRDRAAVERVHERLRAEGFAALFLGFDPAQGIPAGRSWERELYAQLRKSDGVIFLASAASVTSSWCFAEVSLARSLGRPVFPLRLDAGARLSLLDDVQWVDLAEGEPAFTRLLAGLRRAGADPSDSFDWAPARAPFPGLEPFGSEDAAVFFGRDQEIDRLLELLQPTLQRGAGRFVAIVGPSGSGKSSLLRAGLLPRLRRLQERWVLLPPLLPGQRPTENLARSLARGFAERERGRPVAELETQLSRGAPALVDLAGELCEVNGGRSNLLVVVDQAEELLTRSGVREQQNFLRLLGGALGDDSPLWVVATVRSEFLSTAPERAGLAEVVDDPLMIEPLSRSRLPEVIERPAQRAGLDFAPGLVERMVEETTGGDALPLLAYTLRELYQRAGPDGMVSAADYEAVGGVVGALQRRADRLVDELTRRGQGPLVLPTLLKLAAIEGEGEPIRRRLQRSALSVDEQAVVGTFVDARLLTSGKTADEEATVEVAHEALLRQWPPLREAIEASRASLRMRSELERLATDWDRGRRDESYLLRGGRLATFDRWAIEHRGELSLLERQFLEASRALASRELDAARRSNRRLRGLVAGLAFLLVLTLGAGVLAFQNNRQAQSQARLALSGALSVQADSLVQTRPDTAILVGLESLSVARDDTPKPQPPAGLITGLARVDHASKPITGHTGQLQGVAFSLDGKLLATASRDTTARLWDATAGKQRGQPLRGHEDAVLDVTFSPDGGLLATAGRDGTVRLWDVASGKQHGKPLTGHTEPVNAVAFSPDGKLLATAGRDKTARLWDATSGKQGRILTGHEDAVLDVAFSPDGKLLATASRDKTARLWDATSGKQGRTLTGHTEPVNGVAFSPDGTLLATVSTDETVRLWNVASGKQHGQPLTGHTNAVQDVAFSPDGKLLATASADQTARLWDVAPGKQHGQPLTGHTNAVQDVAFSPNGKLTATAGEDGTARLWEVDNGRQFGPPLTGHTGVGPQPYGPLWGVAFSPDGKLLATAGGDGTARLWSPWFTSWVEYGCALVNRNLSMTEWNQFVQGRPYERTCPNLPSGDGAPANAPVSRY